MRNKKWWKVWLPVIVAFKIVLVVLILGSAKSENTEIVVKAANEYIAFEKPASVSFAGEPMPIERFDIWESLDRELLSNAYFHSQTIRYIKLAPRYFPIIEPILKEHGIPEDFKYLAVAESGFNPSAISSARAIGFWQFMKGTAEDYGLEVNNLVDERYHVEKSTHAACKYLKDSYEKFGSWTLVAASYNRGRTGVIKQMTRQKADDYYNLLLTTETARYVFRIVALKMILEDPEAYNFFISGSEKYAPVKTREVEVSGKVENFADFAKEHGTNYKLLKNFNPWLRDNYLTNATGKKYIIKIPELN